MGIKYDLILKIKQERLNKQWRKKNAHNFTTVKSIFPIDRVVVGKGTYGSLDVELYGSEQASVEIGNYCSIARDVRFIADGGHELGNSSLYPFSVRYLGEVSEATTKGPIRVGDDVWIGERSMILSGVTIGQGAVIAAGSIVTKDVPPYGIFAGGKVIRYRFSDEEIQKLLKFHYEKITDEDIKKSANDFYKSPEDFFVSELYKKYADEI